MLPRVRRATRGCRARRTPRAQFSAAHARARSYIFFNCGYCGCTPCKDTTATVENAAEIAGGAPGTAVMER